ncbi:Stk1 family PASTA domain-containing Ser/Thr kinase [Demequina sp. B12]|uniref:Stk1 family PASTA domain-containing Ser/Thr kinase n=1 Tax=Demequina sp. B12 TaxID=2992757 RepID=UPI00237B3D60|nr:Stk1 family PASTA domain-containing Ser/Thr kinase [Demequina sp. B12]MDE0572090.1 Stk1 family PASTA domain-containing Ser/Thr kinase [Demequina sp. B12]
MNDQAKILGGRYEIGDLIGRGGMAEVHIGYDTRLGRTVAIKILRADLARDPSFQTRFRREAQAAAGLNHPAIVAVYDTGEEHTTGPDGNPQAVPYIVMEYVEGHTVRDILKGDVAAPIDEAVEIASGVLTALDYAHHAGLVHRDIKPANVMLTPTGAVKVMDFGIARALADAGNTVTQTQAVVGTAQYLSPEQARGETVDARSDLYSTGCLLFELLTGRPPFIGDSPVSVAYQHVREEPPAPSQFASDVPRQLDQVVLRSLAKNRDARYSTAQEFLSDLRAVLGGGTVSPSTGAVAVGGVAAGAAAGAVAGAAMAGGMTPEEIAEQPTQAMPVTPGPETNATEVMSPSQQQAWGDVMGGGAAGGSVPPPQTSSVPVTGEHDLVDEDAERKRKIILWSSLGGAALLAIIIVLWILLSGGEEPAESTTVSVPNVVGLEEAEAVAQIEDLGLVAEVTYAASTDVEAGFVVSTDPEPNTELEIPASGQALALAAGQNLAATEAPAEAPTVTLTVSSGPDALEVPSVRGKTQEAARLAIEEAGLRVGDVQTVDDPDMEKGRVVETDPAEGESVAPDTAITLYVASGEVELPDLVGMDEDRARAELQGLGLIPSITDVEDDSVDEGTVLSQSPNPGTVEQGSTVELDVAVKPSLVTIPDVTGRSQAEAERELGTLGLSFNYGTPQFSNNIPAGAVISQNPNPGTQVAPDTVVTLVLSQGPDTEPEPEPEPTVTATP